MRVEDVKVTREIENGGNAILNSWFLLIRQ